VWSSVTCGVSQGSVLRPILITIFIKVLDCKLKNSVLKFADDTKLFGAADSTSCAKLLQENLNTLCTWAAACREM